MHKDKPLRSFISESKSICTCISCYIILYELLLKKIGINQIKSNQDKEADKSFYENDRISPQRRKRKLCRFILIFKLTTIFFKHFQ